LDSLVSDLSLPIICVIGADPLAQFADWKLASDEADLKGEAYLLHQELTRRDAFHYRLVRGDHS
jgi:hypothetical protein